MNKIIVENGFIKDPSIDTSIIVNSLDNYLLQVRELEIIINASTDLEIILNSKEEIKTNINITVKNDAKVNIFQITTGVSSKYHFSINLLENSCLYLEKIYDVSGINEQAIVKLNGEFACYKQVLKTVASFKEKYELLIYHNAKNTTSNILNNGISKTGELKFNVSAFVPNKIKGCVVEQNNRIINLNNLKCSIKPNLFIDEFDVTANHSAYIDNFSNEEMFYLNRLGIDNKTAINLLTRGFLTNQVTNPDLVEPLFSKL